MKPSTHPGERLDEAFRSHRAELVRVAAFKSVAEAQSPTLVALDRMPISVSTAS